MLNVVFDSLTFSDTEWLTEILRPSSIFHHVMEVCWAQILCDVIQCKT